MFDDYNICPYTGLRPFTEEESLYFKGRDEHIDQATKQLGENKFLILTGASGDGKSSLVYAGIIPNAKAGFLKSTYANWAITDFRPERSPLYNFSKSVADQLGIENIHTVQTELSHGYASLVDLYKASMLYLDPNDPEWIDGDDSLKNSMKRKAANFLIVADQFEEFFTNPENYNNGVPSEEANLVTNLLLETARIALEENLPIYVIITMRSDFIGQCASFRGLPEYIGFSQFFVPRLNRKQLQEVIEEPAILSGNKISRRLTERLILDIVEGTDQLPILQHALNQIWKMADEGKEEMDLIHYAMVGGMDGKELPDDSFLTFNQWFNDQAQKIKDCYDQPGLQNVLNTHANKLYNLCFDNLNSQQKENLSDEEAKSIIKTAFKCLTKIDNSRAVRNRMTLGEITSIINVDKVDYNKVGIVLSIYRETGNTLLRPFIEENVSLDENTVLDITHESLIRNWDYLDLWAKEEYDNYTTYLDFKQQLNRWVQSGKSSSFLLYIGPLTFFENWFESAKPNISWIGRYQDDESSKEKESKSEEILSNSHEFINRSAKKHVITRTIMHYGPRRIAATIGLIAILVFSSFIVKNYIERQNNYVLNKIKEQTLEFSNNPKVIFDDKITLLAEILKNNSTSLEEIKNSIEDPIEKAHIINGLQAILLMQGRNEPEELILNCIQSNDNILEAFPISYVNNGKSERILKEINNFRSVLELAYYYNPSKEIKEYIIKNAGRSAKWVNYILTKQPEGFKDISNLNLAIENSLNYGEFTEKEILNLIYIISPIENQNRTSWVETNYHLDKLLTRGSQNYGFKFNGLYHELAHLNAAAGNTEKALQCIDSLNAYTDNYYGNNYINNADNATNIAATFFLNGKEKAMHKFVTEYCAKISISTIDFYDELIGNSIASDYLISNTELYDFNTSIGNLNLQGSGNDQKRFFFDQYRNEINNHAKNSNERDFLLAVSYKNQGISELMKLELEGKKVDKTISSKYFDQAIRLFESVSQDFLKENISISITGSGNFTVTRNFLFLYPDIRLSKQPLEPRSYYFYYYSGVFIDYILDNNLFDKLYTSETEIKYFENWLREYNAIMFQSNYFIRKQVSFNTLAKLEKKLAERNAIEYADLNLLYLYLAVEESNKDNSDNLRYYANNLKTNNFNNLFNYRAFNNQINFHSFRLVAQTVTELFKYGYSQEANRLIQSFNNPINRSTIYAFAAKEMQFQDTLNEKVVTLIDSSYQEISRIENLTTGQPNRTALSYALALQNNQRALADAYKIIKNVPFKFVGYERISRALAFRNDMYQAYNNIPGNLSDTDISVFLWNILYGYNMSQESESNDWNNFNINYPWWQTRLIIYSEDVS